MPPVNEMLEWRGQTMVGSGGDKIGKIEEIYLDTETEQPEWALVQHRPVRLGGLIRAARRRELAGRQRAGPFEKAQIKDAPKLEPDGQLSHQDESALYSHYGLDYGESRSGSGLPRASAPPPCTDTPTRAAWSATTSAAARPTTR